MEDKSFRFDEATHSYFSAGRRIPSVTKIVGSICGGPQFATAWHMHKGSMLHKAIALYLGERLDEKTVDERILRQLNSAKRAIAELQIRPTLIEFPLYHKTLGFAGTPDLLTDKGWLIDFKSGHVPEVQIQAGGYVVLLEANKYPVKKALEIVLEDNRYVIYEHKIARCKGLFLAALSLYQWRANGK